MAATLYDVVVRQRQPVFADCYAARKRGVSAIASSAVIKFANEQGGLHHMFIELIFLDGGRIGK